ncbi:hypothetical protein EDD22DRAFT_937016 [Suillus occidentalis]|nr:hypothetical protein EDD22DRAFT_937016 [Suillus occidentalis]
MLWWWILVLSQKAFQLVVSGFKTHLKSGGLTRNGMHYRLLAFSAAIQDTTNRGMWSAIISKLCLLSSIAATTAAVAAVAQHFPCA